MNINSNSNKNFNNQNLTLQQSILRANVLKSKTLKTNEKTPTEQGLDVSNDVQEITTDKTGTNTKGNVIVEFSDNRVYTIDEWFAMDNKEKNPTWTIGGEDIKYNDLSEDTKTYLSEFNNVLRKSNKDGINFTKSLEDLGNAYAKKKEELAGKYSGDELNSKLDELEKAFKAFVERKVIGSTGNEPMTMATQARFKIEHAKSLRYAAEVREAYLKGENMNSVKKRGITSDDKQLLENLMKTAKSALNNITEFFNKTGAIKGSERETLKNYVGEEGSWSLGKLSTVYQLIDNVDNPNLDQYSSMNIVANDNPNRINTLTKFDNLFTENEKAVYQELYNWNK